MNSKYRILLIDNYDSYTYNLFHYFQQITECDIVVLRYDELDADSADNFSHIVVSPGPGLPEEYPIVQELILKYYESKHILGICMGLQCMITAFNGKLKNLDTVMHGVSSQVNILSECPEFEGIPKTISVGHYHSWVADDEEFPQEFQVTSTNKDGLIMSVRNNDGKLCGIQFHPESIMTPQGLTILKNWWEYSTK